jgi:hypothetical protein
MNLNIFSIFIIYLIHTQLIHQANSFRYDYCNINESKAAYVIIKEAIEYFNLSNNTQNEKCLLLNSNIINYYERFDFLESENKNSYNQFKCPECNKRFKNKSYANLHYKLFHISTRENYTSKFMCPGDLCKILNCDRYKSYLAIPFPDNSNQTQIYNKQVIERYQECNKHLVDFYRSSCLKLISNCLDHLEEENRLDKYFEFYNNFCMKIDCERPEMKYEYKKDLQREGGLWDMLRMILVYIVSIFIFIFMLIIWISKYS